MCILFNIYGLCFTNNIMGPPFSRQHANISPHLTQTRACTKQESKMTAPLEKLVQTPNECHSVQ